MDSAWHTGNTKETIFILDIFIKHPLCQVLEAHWQTRWVDPNFCFTYIGVQGTPMFTNCLVSLALPHSPRR